jgi:cellulose biosynthesis protein BcsQ
MSLEDFGISLSNVKEFAAAIGGVLTFTYTIFLIGRRFGGGRKIIEELKAIIEKLKAENKALQDRVDSIDALVLSRDDFWSRPPKAPIDLITHRGQISASMPVISVVNFKGGVGKTTICANLAGYFARTGKRVLLIDFDYQGSLSDTLLSHARIDRFTATSQRLIEGQERPDQLRHVAERLTGLSSNMWIYPAFYGFSRAEIQVMFRWLTAKDPEIRYNLHRYLQSRAFQIDPDYAFDMVLIDCPPRLLTGSVNALAASTHVLVPTILDGQSHVATLNTLGAIQQFRQTLNPGLKTLGVVPSLVAQEGGYNPREKLVIEELERQIAKFHDPVPVLKERPIVRKELLAKAGGSEVVYLTPSNAQPIVDIRSMFASLAQYVEQQVTWKQRETGRVYDIRGGYDEDRRTASGS